MVQLSGRGEKWVQGVLPGEADPHNAVLNTES